MILFYSNVSDFIQNFIKVFQLAQISKMLLELPHDSSSLKGSVYFAIRAKKEWQKFGHYFAVDLVIFLP